MRESEFNKERDLEIESVGCKEFLVHYSMTFEGQAVIKVPNSKLSDELTDDEKVRRVEYIEDAMNHREISTMMTKDETDGTNGLHIYAIEEWS